MVWYNTTKHETLDNLYIVLENIKSRKAAGIGYLSHGIWITSKFDYILLQLSNEKQYEDREKTLSSLSQ